MSSLDDLYQSLILDHNRRPRNYGEMEQADRRAEGRNPLCGDELTVWLRMDDATIADVRFVGAGCAISKASASMMTAAVKGRTTAEATELFDRFHDLVTGKASRDDSGLSASLAAFAGVARFPVRVKCASLAWHTLRSALAQQAPDGFAPVARLADVAPGALLGVTATGGVPLCLANLNGTVHALHDLCTHQAFALSAGELLPDGTLQCAWHGARFDVRTGAVCQGPACDALRTYPVRVADGVIYVQCPNTESGTP